MAEIRLPHISATTADEKLAQMQSYLYQLVEQLNWALQNVDTGETQVVFSASDPGKSTENSLDTFNSIKSLIINSADIIRSYADKMTEVFNGEYVAQSDFGTYLEKSKLTVETDPKTIVELFENQQALIGTISDEQKKTNAYIKRGILYTDSAGNPVYGVEIGQEDSDGGFRKYARFVADRLSFYDENGTEAAYISQRKLYITEAAFTGSIQMGGYKLDTSNGLAFTWIGE